MAKTNNTVYILGEFLMKSTNLGVLFSDVREEFVRSRPFAPHSGAV